MTIFGWDASHYDAPPTKRDGISFYTHKCAEGHHFYRDAEYGDAMGKACALGIPILGAYYVNHPGTVTDQVDWFVSLVRQYTPWWRDYPWIWQIDAEKFSYMDRAPNLAEINAFGDLICSRTGSPADSVIAYAPKWLYGDKLRGLKYRLWASNYGTNPAVPYRQAYPGDSSARWASYSGQQVIVLQYGSATTIGGQTTCDANAHRGTEASLAGLLRPTPPPPPPTPPTRGGTMLLVKTAADDTTWRSDGKERTAMRSGSALKALKAAGHTVAVVANAAELEDAAGPVWAGPVSATFTDAQVARIAEQLVAATDNPLGPADVPAIVAAVKQAQREGTGTAG